MKENYDFINSKKSRLIEKLKILKETHKTQAEKVKSENLCRDLILYYGDIKGNWENDDTDNSLESTFCKSTNKLIDTINDAQDHLKVGDLSKITKIKMPDDKSLGDLITFYEENKDKAPVPSQPQIITKLENGEPIVVAQIIQECDLDLNENSSLAQVIERINKLIQKKPPIIRPVNQPNDTPFGENLEVIKQLELTSLR